jgi:hypothetical protein
VFDAKLNSALSTSVNITVPWYLMASWAYYVEDAPILSDGAYDALCVRMRRRWMWISHWHKPLVSYDELIAGTCLLQANKYPLRVVGALNQLRGEAQ